MADEKNDNDVQEEEASAEPATLIEPPSTLQEKVGPPQPGGLDMAALERAEAVISSLSDQYLDWVKDDLENIQKAYEALQAADGADEEQLKKIFQISHDIKGQGGSFGYELMTTVGNSLCRFIEGKDSIELQHLDIVKLHIDTLKAIIKQDIQGDGGDLGKQLLTGLTMAAEKVTKP